MKATTTDTSGASGLKIITMSEFVKMLESAETEQDVKVQNRVALLSEFNHKYE